MKRSEVKDIKDFPQVVRNERKKEIPLILFNDASIVSTMAPLNNLVKKAADGYDMRIYMLHKALEGSAHDAKYKKYAPIPPKETPILRSTSPILQQRVLSGIKQETQYMQHKIDVMLRKAGGDSGKDGRYGPRPGTGAILEEDERELRGVGGLGEMSEAFGINSALDVVDYPDKLNIQQDEFIERQEQKAKYQLLLKDRKAKKQAIKAAKTANKKENQNINTKNVKGVMDTQPKKEKPVKPKAKARLRQHKNLYDLGQVRSSLLTEDSHLSSITMSQVLLDRDKDSMTLGDGSVSMAMGSKSMHLDGTVSEVLNQLHMSRVGGAGFHDDAYLDSFLPPTKFNPEVDEFAQEIGLATALDSAVFDLQRMHPESMSVKTGTSFKTQDLIGGWPARFTKKADNTGTLRMINVKNLGAQFENWVDDLDRWADRSRTRLPMLSDRNWQPDWQLLGVIPEKRKR